MIHSCGMVDLVEDLAFSPAWSRRRVQRCRAAPRSSATRRWWPVGSPGGGCPPTTRSSARSPTPASPDLAQRLGTTRTAAAVELWGERLDGAVVAIGNAPTALFHLLDRPRSVPRRPAAVLGMPVGFVGAAESKRALAQSDLGLAHVVVHGRRGGSAITAAPSTRSRA